MRDGTIVKRDSMSGKSKNLSYHETNQLRLVRIPYEEQGCSMIVALPLDEAQQIGMFRDSSLFGSSRVM